MATDYPKLEFHLLQRFSWEVLDDLRSERLDAAYIYSKKTCPEIRAVPLRTYNLVIVGPTRWKDQIEQADWKEISELPWIWISHHPGCPFHKIANEMFHKRNLEPSKVAVVADEESAFKTLVTSGVGLTLMIENQALAAEQEGKLVIWEKDKLPIDLSFAYLRKREHDPLIQAILNGIFIVWDITDCQKRISRAIPA
jgi:DNA-binding transcriptional LysR family regulator